jgi:hypothetical protein
MSQYQILVRRLGGEGEDVYNETVCDATVLGDEIAAIVLRGIADDIAPPKPVTRERSAGLASIFEGAVRGD